MSNRWNKTMFNQRKSRESMKPRETAKNCKICGRPIKFFNGQNVCASCGKFIDKMKRDPADK